MAEGIILAAGRGSRMKEKTESIPKGMNEIEGQTFLQWELDSFSAAGISNVHILTGYQKEVIESFHPSTIQNENWKQTNMVSTLFCADELLINDTCLISYSDILYHPKHLKALDQATADIAITYDTKWRTLWELRFENPLEDAETFEQNNGLLKSIGKKADSMDVIEGQYMGLLRITPNGWEEIQGALTGWSPEKIAKLDMTTLLNHLLESGLEIQCVPIAGQWCEIDDGNDLSKYEQELKQNPNWEHDWRWK